MFLNAAVLAAALSFHCTHTNAGDERGPGRFNLNIRDNVADVTVGSTRFPATLDGNSKVSRFVFPNDRLIAGYSLSLVVSEEVLNKQAGKVSLQGRGDAFLDIEYTCNP